MGSGRDAVHKAIEDDVFLQEAIARGIVNASALGRWLLQNRELTTSREAIAQHVRELQKQTQPSLLKKTCTDIASAKIRSVSGRALVRLSREPEAGDRLTSLIHELNLAHDADLWLLTGRTEITLVLPEEGLASLRAALGDRWVEEVLGGLTEIHIGPTPQGSGVHQLVTALKALIASDVHVFQTNAGASGVRVLVAEAQRLSALRIVGGVSARS